MKNDLGVIGLAVMGANLAQNLADHKLKVAVFNRTAARTQDLIKTYGANRGLDPYFDLKKFIASLSKPRVVLLMVQAGAGTDAVLEEVSGLLEKGDIVIDGGNSFFKDTIRREVALKERGLNFVGMGVSGGEEGARRGPAIMPGGSQEAWRAIGPIFSKIAAKDFSGKPCITHVGENGAGHFIKMVHNAIEYVDMQLIAEIYWIMKKGMGLSNEKMADIFAQWNKGRLNSYLIEITAKILKTKDERGKFVIDYILDAAGNKGTGKWTSIEGLDLGIPAFSIATSVFARYISAFKKERLQMSKVFKNRGAGKKINPHTTGLSPHLVRCGDLCLWSSGVGIKIGVNQLEKALYAGKILAYAQGYEYINFASKQYGWNIDLKEISRIWQGGCIIRAKFLNNLYQIFKATPALENILFSRYFKNELGKTIGDLRKVICASVNAEIPIPCLLSAIAYFDSRISANLPANLIQAQRDFFGAHTFQTEINGEFLHFKW